MREFAAPLSFVLLALAACETPPELACPDRADNVTYVDAGGTCLALSTHGAAQRGQAVSLVVLLDGRDLKTRKAFGAQAKAEAFAGDGVISIAMAPPGLRLGAGPRSDVVGSGNAPVPPGAVADIVPDGIQNLRIHYAAGRVVLVGYGDAAATAGVVLGRSPGLVTDAVLVRCPCGVAEAENDDAMTPISLAKRVPPGTRVVLVGTDGAGSAALPDIQGYAERLQDRGVEARIDPLASTDDTSVDDAVGRAVADLLR